MLFPIFRWLFSKASRLVIEQAHKQNNNRNMDKQLISLMLKLHNGAKCFLKVEFEFLLHLLFDEAVSKVSVFETLRAHCLSKYLIRSNLKAKDLDFKKVLAPLLSSY